MTFSRRVSLSRVSNPGLCAQVNTEKKFNSLISFFKQLFLANSQKKICQSIKFDDTFVALKPELKNVIN